MSSKRAIPNKGNRLEHKGQIQPKLIKNTQICKRTEPDRRELKIGEEGYGHVENRRN
jgi:hypothetical protein